MLIARWILVALAAASILCFGLYIGTGQLRFRRIGLHILRGTVTAGLVFFAVMALERLWLPF